MPTSFLMVLVLASTAFATEYAQHVRTSLSIRPPNRQTRIVDADTLQNPFDYEMAIGFERPKGWAKVWFWTWRERESGLKLTGRDLRIVLGGRYLEMGFAFTDRDDRDIHVGQYHGAVKLFKGAVGVGVVRQYYSLWGDATWMGRASLDYALHDRVKLHGVYSTNFTGKRKLSGQLDITAVTFGPDERLRFGPTAKGLLLDGPGGRKTSYQIKLELSLAM